jgi:DNA topoisomerase-2
LQKHWLKIYGNEYRKLSNQARFVTEIIDNKLIVSKKAKPKLVEELRKKNYEAFPKVQDAKKSDETDDVVENTDEVAADEEGGARDFDYLLGMPIWSLTQERVDKLRQQMRDKQQQLEDFKALSEKDLWCQDLDDFLDVWKIRVAEDAEITKKIRGMGRRASKKIGAGKTNNAKSRMKADDDFMPSVPKASKPSKANPAKGEVKVTAAASAPQNFMKNFMQAQPKSKPKTFGSDGAEELSDDDLQIITKTASRAPSEQPAIGGRTKRAAAAKPKAWVEDDDESSGSDDDKLLGDIGDMVKGIGAGNGASKPTNGRVSLYGMSRRESSAGRPTSSSEIVKPKPKMKAFDLSDDDETNYEMLAKSSPHKAAPVVNNDLGDFLSDDEDDLPVLPKKAAVTKVKAAPKPKKAPVVKKAVAQHKPLILSPAAKAYQKKAAQPKTKADEFEMSDDEDIDMADPDSPPPKPAARGRPARAAAAKPKKAIYIDSDDDMEEDVDQSALVDDDEESEDFDESE